MEAELKFSPERIEALRVLVSIPGWKDAYEPTLAILRDTWNRLLIDRSQKRKDEWSDDYIGGCIATLDAILAMPATLIGEADEIRERVSQEKREANAYAQRAALGRIGPFINPDEMPTISE